MPVPDSSRLHPHPDSRPPSSDHQDLELRRGSGQLRPPGYVASTRPGGTSSLTRRCSGLASLAAELHSLGRAGPSRDYVAGVAGLRSGRPLCPCPLIRLWQSRRAIKIRPASQGGAAPRHAPLSGVCGGRQVLAHHPGPAAVRHRQLTRSRLAETVAPFKDYSRITANNQGVFKRDPEDSRPSELMPSGMSGPARLPLRLGSRSIGQEQARQSTSHRGTA